MSTDFHMPDSWYQPPDVRELADDPGTLCVNNDCDDPREHLVCPLCDGTVCLQADDTTQCDGETVHEACHRQGCYSAECAADARDDALLHQDEVNRGR